MRPLEMADSLAGKVREVQTQLADSRRESERLNGQLQDALMVVDTTRWHLETVQRRLEEENRRLTQDLRDAREQAADLGRKIAGYESKTFSGILKRALQVALDMFQILTPGPIRAAFRKYYLNWFYYRVYPERRA